jgi:recombination protein RecR
MYPEPLQRLLQELARLPGVGARTAERFAFHLLKDAEPDALRLAKAVADVKRMLRPCANCGMVTDETSCKVCQDETRDASLICVVEQPKDLYAIERLGMFRGVYHVLMGAIALLDGIAADKLNIEPLIDRVRRGGVREVVIATNPNLEGDTTALHLVECLRSFDVTVSRIARGVSAGSPLAQASRAVLEDALADRRVVNSA